jgi:hypothetical protein
MAALVTLAVPSGFGTQHETAGLAVIRSHTVNGSVAFAALPHDLLRCRRSVARAADPSRDGAFRVFPFATPPFQSSKQSGWRPSWTSLRLQSALCRIGCRAPSGFPSGDAHPASRGIRSLVAFRIIVASPKTRGSAADLCLPPGVPRLRRSRHDVATVTFPRASTPGIGVATDPSVDRRNAFGSRSALVVLHHLDGLLRPRASGVLQPDAGRGSPRFTFRVPTLITAPLPMRPSTQVHETVPRDAIHTLRRTHAGCRSIRREPRRQPHHVAVAVASMPFSFGGAASRRFSVFGAAGVASPFPAPPHQDCPSMGLVPLRSSRASIHPRKRIEVHRHPGLTLVSIAVVGSAFELPRLPGESHCRKPTPVARGLLATVSVRPWCRRLRTNFLGVFDVKERCPNLPPREGFPVRTSTRPPFLAQGRREAMPVHK